MKKPVFKGKKKGILTIEEILKIIDTEPAKHRAKAVVLLGALAGLRRGEIKGLRWGCVDLEAGILDVQKNIVGDEEKGPKDDSYGKVMIASQLADVLIKLKSETPYSDSKDFVIFNESGRGKAAHDVTFLRALKITLNDIGIGDEEIKRRRLCLHGLRHFFATFSQAAGLNAFLASKLTRHKSPKVFETYSDHAEIIELDAARAAIEGKLKNAASGI